MLTDKSTIPLTTNDLRWVEGERCLLDRRLNLRLGYGRGTEVRDLIKRNQEDFERRFGPLRHRAAMVRHPQGGSIQETQFFLTKGQALWVCRKSDARNADDVMEEIIKVFLAVDAGAPIPDTPFTDALFAPERPTIERGDDNVVHVTHEPPLPEPDECERERQRKSLEQWQQSVRQEKFDFGPPPIKPAERLLDELTGLDPIALGNNGAVVSRAPEQPRQHPDFWTDEQDGRSFRFSRTFNRNGVLSGFYAVALDGIRKPTELHIPMPVALPNGKAGEGPLFVHVSDDVPFHILHRNFLKLGVGPFTNQAINTLWDYLSFRDGIDDAIGGDRQ